MFDTVLSALKSGIEEVVRHVRTVERIQALSGLVQPGLESSILESYVTDILEGSPSLPQWRVIEHCSAIGRLYALYEHFCENVLAEWIEVRRQNVRFIDLPESMRSAYHAGFVHVLGALSSARYAHLSAEQMIAEHNLALNGSMAYRLFPECLTFHKNNIRVAELNDILKRCGIEGLDGWVSQHPSLRNYFSGSGRILDQVTSKLKDFIQYRNDAAHASVQVDEILGADELIDTAKFIEILCEVVHQLITFNAISYLESAGIVHRIGIVTESYSSGIVVAIVEGATLEVGGRIYVVTSNTCEPLRILSVMIDDVSHTIFSVANSREVGLKFGIRTPKRAKLMVLANSNS